MIKNTAIIETMMRVWRREAGSDVEALKKELADKSRADMNPPIIPPMRDIAAAEHTCGGFSVYTLTPETLKTERTLLYLHGGGYKDAANVFHWRFCERFAEDAGCRVLFPIYPLTPKYTYKDAYAFLDTLYAEELKGTAWSVMGDSAGGGLAVGFMMELASRGEAGPEKAVLLSPWLDITMSDPDMKDYVDVEPLLDIDRLRLQGLSWAGDTDPTDWHVSPINGAASVLPPTLIFTGTHEILHPEAVKFAARVPDCKLITAEGMAHCYPLFPIQEAEDALKRMPEFVEADE